jgi:bifunctional non-homologous end joining protein LigD
MLATLTDQWPAGRNWLYERKLDGVRCLVFAGKGVVRLLSRNRKPMDSAYPEIVDALAQQDVSDFIVDGEVVAFEGQVTSFSRLQGRLGLRHAIRAAATGIKIHYYLFDLLYAHGHELTGLPLRKRKALLRRLITFQDPLRYSTHRLDPPRSYWSAACARGWEGLIAKRADSTYQPMRSRDWLKLKCTQRQEFVVIGFTEPRGSRSGLGALLLGYYQDGLLRYAGKVGTGFDDRTLLLLRKELDSIEIPVAVIKPVPAEVRRAHWVRPILVAEIVFAEWTPEGRLRQPRFIGLRDDRPAAQVVRERPVH